MPWQRAVFGEFHRLWNAIRETASKLEVPTASVETRTPFELPVRFHTSSLEMLREIKSELASRTPNIFPLLKQRSIDAFSACTSSPP